MGGAKKPLFYLEPTSMSFGGTSATITFDISRLTLPSNYIAAVSIMGLGAFGSTGNAAIAGGFVFSANQQGANISSGSGIAGYAGNNYYQSSANVFSSASKSITSTTLTITVSWDIYTNITFNANCLFANLAIYNITSGSIT